MKRLRRVRRIGVSGKLIREITMTSNGYVMG
jgi:hypothetical protein